MIQRKTLKLFKKIAKLVEPPPDISVSKWAEDIRVLSKESSAEPGRYRVSRVPYQEEIQDSISDPKISHVIIISSAQVGKTEILNNGIGCSIDIDPYPILVVMPTEALAKTWSKKRLSPMLRDTPILQNKVAEARSRDGENTILEKSFPGGYIAMVGANSPVGLSPVARLKIVHSSVEELSDEEMDFEETFGNV